MITASIVLYNTSPELVCTILNCSIDSIIELIFVIDNSPTDKLRSIVQQFSKVKYIYGHGNVGYGAGHNIAIHKAINLNSTYHVVLNPDVRFDKGTIEALAEFASNHDDIGMLMPNVKYPDDSQQFLCKLLPTPFDILGRRLLPRLLVKRTNYYYEMHFTNYKDIRNVPCLSGCFMFLNMDIIKCIGMFDDRFFMYFEDFDLVRRIHQVSKTVYFPRVTIIHDHATEHRTNTRLLKISISSAIKYFNKWGWLFDSERRRINKEALSDINIII